VLGDTLKVADAMGQHFGLDKPAARPFDIQDYTTALQRLNEAVTNLHQLSLSADQLVRSEGWRSGLRSISSVADRRADRVFALLCLVLGLAFLLAVAYRVISIQLNRRIGPPGREKE
jgi:hypothetical protein